MPTIIRLFASSRGIAAALLLSLAIAAGASYLLVGHTTERIIAKRSEQIAFGWAGYLAQEVGNVEAVANGAPLDEDTARALRSFVAYGEVFRFKLFTRDGRLRLVSDDLNTAGGGGITIGEHNPSAALVITTGQPHTEVKDGRQKPDRPDTYVESYVPLMVDGNFAAIAEVYVDQTRPHAVLKAEFTWFQLLLSAGLMCVLALPCFGLWRMTRALQRKNAELKENTERTRRADQAKGEFLANMSHEIRTPLNGMLGMAELLQQTELTDKQRRHADVIMRSGKSLLTILNDVLDFSKIEAGMLEMENRPFRFHDLVDEVTALLGSQAGNKNVELIARLHPALPQCFIGDPGRIRQILVNLTGNAIKFTSEGHVTIEATARRREGVNDTDMRDLIIRVVDTGEGIPAEQQARIFDKFSQVDGSKTRIHGGTGLGLAIVRMLVETMGGSIRVDSEPGVGSTFIVRLPLAAQDISETAIAAPEALRGRKVLVIDDNDVNREILLQNLVAWGLVAENAATGVGGMQALAEAASLDAPFELVILDYQMPGMDGADVVRQMRNTDSLADTPVIVLSSADSALDRSTTDALSGGCALTKPVSSAELLQHICGALGANVCQPAEPAEAAEDTADGPTVQAVSGENATDGPAPLLVLVAEDNPVNQELAIGILEMAGCDVLIANNGEEAVESYVARRPDLVLMDLSMPVMGGLEAAKAIRKLEDMNDWHRTSMIGVTAHAYAGDRASCLEAGMDDFLPKPITVAKMLGKIEAITADRQDMGSERERRAS